jgi:hypothetical protein
MQVLVLIRQYVDLRELWPYARELRATPSGTQLTLEVHDSRELVSALIAIAGRGAEIEAVDIRTPHPDTTG